MNASNESSIYSMNMNIVVITSTTINLVLGVPINSWVMWLVLTGPAGTMASEFFTLNLSVCEIIFSVLYLPAYINNNIIQLAIFVYGLLFTGRPVFQCCMCVERFMAVVHPVIFLKYKPLRYRVACSVVAWLVIIGASLLNVLISMLANMIIYYAYLSEFLFFMSVMLLCSLAVLRALKQPRPGETGRERDNSMKRRAFIIICLILGSFLGSYLLWCIFFIFCIQGLDQDLILRGIAVYISMVTGFVQPLLYLCQKTGKLTCVKPIEDT